MTIFKIFIFSVIWSFGVFCQLHAQDLSIEQMAGAIQDESDPLDQLLAQIDQKDIQSVQPHIQPSARENTPCGTLVCDEQVIERILRVFLSTSSPTSQPNFSNSLSQNGNQSGRYEKKMIFIPYQVGAQVNLAAPSGFLPPRPSHILGAQSMPEGCPCGQNGAQMGDFMSSRIQPAPTTPPINQMFFQMPCGSNNQSMPMEGYPYSAASIFDCINGCVGKLPPTDGRALPPQPFKPNQFYLDSNLNLMNQSPFENTPTASFESKQNPDNFRNYNQADRSNQLIEKDRKPLLQVPPFNPSPLRNNDFNMPPQPSTENSLR